MTDFGTMQDFDSLQACMPEESNWLWTLWSIIAAMNINGSNKADHPETAPFEIIIIGGLQKKASLLRATVSLM